MVASRMAIGRITSSSAATNSAALQSSERISSRLSEAVRMMKTPETSSVVMVSLKRRMSVSEAMRLLARTTPITVTVSSPDSSSSVLVAA